MRMHCPNELYVLSHVGVYRLYLGENSKCLWQSVDMHMVHCGTAVAGSGLFSHPDSTVKAVTVPLFISYPSQIRYISEEEHCELFS